MSFHDDAENDILLLIFNATDWALWADDAASTPETNIGVALHTADPTESGTQLTNEAAYGSYARVDVARTSGGWTVTGASVSPAANIDFPEATSGSETETHFSVAKASNNDVVAIGTVTPNIVVTSGVTPRLTTATALTLE